MFITKKRLAERDAEVKFQTLVEAFVENVRRIHQEWGFAGVNIDETIEHLITSADRIVGNNNHHARLTELSPWWTVSNGYNSKGLMIGEAFGGRTVPLAKLIEWHLKRAHAFERVDRVTASDLGLAYYVGERRVLVVVGGTISPGRLSDSGDRYEIAGEMMKCFTGLEEIDWKQAFHSQVAVMAAERTDDGWHYNTSPAIQPATV